MEFTDEPLQPAGRVLLDMGVESDLGCKTALVYRIVRILQQNAFLPRYGCHLAEVSFEEALANAMIHGNKLDPAKQVRVVVFADASRWGVLVRDQGSGFTPGDLPDPNDPENLFREHGRGIMLMDHYMDQVRCNPGTATVWMVRRPQAQPDPGAVPPVEPARARATPAPAGPLSVEGLDAPAPAAPAEPPPVVLPDDIGMAAAPAAAVPADNGGPVITQMRDGVLVARIHARRLSEDNAAAVRESLLASAASATHVVLDLSELEFMSSVGIGAIVTVLKHTRDHKGRLVLTGVGAMIQNILQATGLHRALAIAPTLDAAVAKARSG